MRTCLMAAAAGSPFVLILLNRWAPAEWVQPFLGRLHPVVVHFPIAFILLAGGWELWRTIRGGSPAAPPRGLLWLGAFCAAVAAALGILLRGADAVEGALVEAHFIAGITVAALSLAAFVLSPGAAITIFAWRRWSYRFVLAAACAAVMAAGHLGGSLTHGEDYLTEFAPWNSHAKKAASAVVSFPTGVPPAQWEAYAHLVAPIFQARCASCHSGRNTKGGLVLVEWEGLAAGGKNGAAFTPGDAAGSLIIQRLALPVDEKEHMPPKRKPQPAAVEVELLKRWIAAGAPRHGTLAGIGADADWIGLAAALPQALAVERPADPAVEEIDPREVARLRAPLAQSVADLQRRFPGVVTYESRQSADIHVNAATLERAFGDAELAAFAPIASRIVWIDLSRTGVTDVSADLLQSMQELRVLRLGETRIGDRTIMAVSGLAKLESLTLFRTAITAASAARLAQLRKLRHLSVAGTAVADLPE